MLWFCIEFVLNIGWNCIGVGIWKNVDTSLIIGIRNYLMNLFLVLKLLLAILM